jgi:hypothetical protein
MGGFDLGSVLDLLLLGFARIEDGSMEHVSMSTDFSSKSFCFRARYCPYDSPNPHPKPRKLDLGWGRSYSQPPLQAVFH